MKKNSAMNLSWYVNRLRAMSLSEIRWRLDQKKLEKNERRAFKNENVKITDKVFYGVSEDLAFHVEKLGLPEKPENYREKEKNLNSEILLLGGFSYDKYKKAWHAGFQTGAEWPLEFSYDLIYKQRDEIGDARTNWELNRHFQFVLLACNYYETGEKAYLDELWKLFSDWNEKNPFLTGISWTSVMEVAIRDINWIFTLGYLKKAENVDEVLLQELRNGIINMTIYILGHYSRFSSANNHVIVEASAIGIAGLVFDESLWYEISMEILRCEIPRQNYKDGVNREVSLHYQSFFMEAAGLLCLLMQRNGKRMPEEWRLIFTRMSRYLAECQGDYGETLVFGDDDEGKILDLCGKSGNNKRNHYQYVLELMSLILPERYTPVVSDVTLIRILSEEEMEKLGQKPLYTRYGNHCFEQGGVSILRSTDGKALIGMDHGPLGFGSIAAHGHADALSFQMYLEGECVFADPGTYIYHTKLAERNKFRKTINHNTLTIDGKDQSEMLGAFLWGKRAETKLLVTNLNEKEASSFFVEAEQNGYAPITHKRRLELTDENTLQLTDTLMGITEGVNWQLGFLLGTKVDVKKENDRQCILTMENGYRISMELEAGTFEMKLENAEISREYGKKEPAKRLCICGNTESDVTICTKIHWENSEGLSK